MYIRKSIADFLEKMPLEMKKPKHFRKFVNENDISNYALLTKKSHIFLHYLEDNYNKEYVYLNKMFLSLNRSVSPPDREYYERVNKVVKSVKKRIKNNFGKLRFLIYKL